MQLLFTLFLTNDKGNLLSVATMCSNNEDNEQRKDRYSFIGLKGDKKDFNEFLCENYRALYVCAEI